MMPYAVGYDNETHDKNQKEDIVLKEIRYLLNDKIYVQKLNNVSADSIDLVKVTHLEEEKFIQLDYIHNGKSYREFFNAGALIV